MNRMLDFFMSDRFFKTMEEPTTTKEAPVPDPSAELRAEIDALKAELEAIKATPAPEPEPESLSEPEPEPEEEKVPFVAVAEPPTAPVPSSVSGAELEEFRKRALRSDRSLGDYYKQNAEAIQSQIKQLLEV